jgi:hypothetical protein
MKAVGDFAVQLKELVYLQEVESGKGLVSEFQEASA